MEPDGTWRLDISWMEPREMGPDKAGPARREFARALDSGTGLVVLLVHGLADVVSGEGGED
jgi:hypothetical protein